MNRLEDTVGRVFNSGRLIKMIISGKRRKSCECRKVTVRPVQIKGEISYQAEFTFEKKVTHENLDAAGAEALALKLLTEEFKQADVFTADEDMHILCSKPEKPHITTGPATKDMPTLELSHNRKKNHVIPEGEPAAFLVRLGVMDEKGNVFRRSYGKFRQINRYLEIVEDVYEYLPKDRPVRIIDFGCGKAYLTFALYHYLHDMKKRDVDIIGLDLKKDVISFCSGVAKDLGYDGLRFMVGDIADFKSEGADMVVTLHACDTATDYALINAVSWNSRVILSVPCCQHELFKQIKNDIHQPMLKYGILRDRLTEYLTDGLRGLKLESKGYDVAMIEFTSLEHTARNIMIKAVKTGSPDSPKSRKALEEYRRLCEFYHVKPTIDRL